jgi:molybdenum cofactor cytidylyltransferase
VSGVVGVILAAGESKRLGRPKQLAVVGDEGETLVGHTLRVARESRCARVALVLGANRVEIEASLERDGVAVIANDSWPEGLASSIRAAVAWAESLPCAALLLMVCDQPDLTSEHIDRLVAKFGAEQRTVGSAYGGVIGVPAVFERARFHELAALRGDQGARALLRGDVGSIDWPEGAVDIDTAADLAALSRGR